MPYLTTNDGAEIYYEERGRRGDGPSLVFIPGLSMSTPWFRNQLDDLADAFHCVAYDPRAHGRSSKVDHGHRMARYGRDLYDVLTALDIRDAIAVGWSYGGMTLLSYAELFCCERLAGIVIIDEAARETNGEDWEWGWGTAEENAEFLQGILDDHRTSASQLVDAIFHHPVEAAVREEMVAGMLETPSRAAFGITRDGVHQDFRDVLPHVTVPTIVAAGAYGSFPAEAHRYTVSRIPDAELVVFEDSGHCPFIEEADKFNAMIRDFGARLQGAATSGA